MKVECYTNPCTVEESEIKKCDSKSSNVSVECDVRIIETAMPKPFNLPPKVFKHPEDKENFNAQNLG